MFKTQIIIQKKCLIQYHSNLSIYKNVTLLFIKENK